MAREPVPGRTKTRLCPPLDCQAAAALYECFLRDVIRITRQVAGVQPVIAYTPESSAAYFDRLAPDLPAHVQQGIGLGERLDHALQLALHGPGQRTAIVMNSDSPDLPADYLRQGFEQLDRGADVVLGPAADGGYYLMGLRAPQPPLLREVTMSTPTVLSDTLALAEILSLRVALLPEWYDIDTVDDLHRLYHALQNADASVAPATQAFFRTGMPGLFSEDRYER